MSRTRIEESRPTNPCKMFLRWASGDKCWRYWDKEAEKMELVPHKTPFIVLDQLSTCSGFNDRKNCGVWSNEVRNLKLPMRVQDKDGEVFAGPWREVKEKVHYAKFCASVYAVAKLGDDYEIVNFQLSGAALSGWIDFVKELGGSKAVYGDVVVSVPSVGEGRKGSVNYSFPEFKVVSNTLSDDARAQADEADSILQSYLTAYFAASPEGKAAKAHSEDVEAYQAPAPSAEPSLPAEEEDDMPF